GDPCGENELPSESNLRRQSSRLSAHRQLAANGWARFEPNPLRRSISSPAGCEPWSLPPRGPNPGRSPPFSPNRQVVEGAAARAAKSLNAGRGDGPTAVTEPDRSQSPRCPCKAPPKFYHPWSGSIAGGRLPTICRFGGRLVQMRSGE